MKIELQSTHLPNEAVLVTCSSHEDRCLAWVNKFSSWAPQAVALFHYDDENPIRESNHRKLVTHFQKSIELLEVVFRERSAVDSLRMNMSRLTKFFHRHPHLPIVFDITVLTKRHLFMMLSWIDDHGLWERLMVVYSEPDEYETSAFLPLSFGISNLQQIPGFPGMIDSSRPLHLVVLLGFEGERALAVYEILQPIKTTLVVPYPPFKMSWKGKVEEYNKDLMLRTQGNRICYVDPIDPNEVATQLKRIFQEPADSVSHSKIVCPLSTKTQAFGVYKYWREAEDPPAILYAAPLRHNHRFYSHGIGRSWLLKEATL